MRTQRQSGSPKRRALLAKIHLLANQSGLEEDTYRDLLERETGARSASVLSEAQLVRICEKLASQKPGAAAAVASGPYVGKIRALWISAYHLGLARSNADAAMISFVERQTKIASTRFLINAKDANKAIEGLKAWLERHGVHWWKHPEQPRRAVVEAQVCKLQELGNIRPYVAGSGDFLEDYVCHVTGKRRGLQFCTDDDWDAAIKALGARLRRALSSVPSQSSEDHNHDEGRGGSSRRIAQRAQ